MITFILLSLFCHSSQDRNIGEQGLLPCGPKNLKLLTSCDQTVQATWEDDPSCSAVKEELVYELLVLVRDEQVHHDLVTVTPEQIGSSHLWRWTSHVALEFNSPSVILSVRYRNYSSPRRPEGTLPGKTNSKAPEVYPQDQVLEVGSRATFYCVLPAGGTFTHMYLGGSNSSDGNITQINNQTYSLTLDLNQPSPPSGTDIKCEATIQHRQTENGATALIGYPPDDKELQCETRDLESVKCYWTVGRGTHLHKPTEYQLVGSAYARLQGTCWGEEDVSTGDRSWKLRAHNELGTVELTDSADLMTRVHMWAPESVTASTVNPRDVRLKWSWKVQAYKDLNITCEVNLSHAGTQKPNSAVGLDFAVLMNLIPNWSYDATVRCRTTQHSWKWSDWSSTFNFHTKGDVPDALDVWMKMKDNEILIIWKILLEKQSHGHVLDYTVTWSNIRGTEQHNTTTVTHNNFTLRLDTTQQYVVNVTARNVNGSSSPSTIITPSSSSSAGLNVTRVKASRVAGGGGGFNLSWSSSPAASCGYIVDWCPSSGPSTVKWIKVTHTNVFLKNLREGQRYSMSISACTRGAALLLETREGYVQEQRIQGDLFKALKSKQKGSDVELSWDQISLTEQTAFIQGYVLEWSDRDEQDNNTPAHYVSTDEPTSTSLTASDLKTGSYTFTVKARTALGECCSTQLIVHVNSRTDNLIRTVVISLVAVFSLLTLVSVVCYRQWTCIRQKVYPPIPRPLLTDTWLRSTGEHSLHVDQGPSEVDIMDAPQLLWKPGAQVNQPPPNLISPPRSLPSPSGLPSSPFRGAFQNLSYDLMMQTEDQQPPEGHTAEYRAPTPPLDPAQEEPGTHMTCDLTYILVPQLTSPEHRTNISDTETS